VVSAAEALSRKTRHAPKAKSAVLRADPVQRRAEILTWSKFRNPIYRDLSAETHKIMGYFGYCKDLSVDKL
jgi:hypothetical protein